MFTPILIVGAGQAAAQAVETLRKRGHLGPLTLVGDENLLPYQRPPLSKKYLAGQMEAGVQEGFDILEEISREL